MIRPLSGYLGHGMSLNVTDPAWVINVRKWIALPETSYAAQLNLTALLAHYGYSQ